MAQDPLSRRAFLASAVIAPSIAFAARPHGSVPVGLELYSVRDELKADLPGTLKTVAGDGYQCVEFFASYYQWTNDYAKDVRKQLDDLGLRCYSTHNDSTYLADPKIAHTIELNQILGARYAVMASAGQPTTLDAWKAVAEKLAQASVRLKKAKLYAGYHNHHVEFVPIDGVRPMEILAKQTDKSVMLQLDVGTCVEAGSDPVAWIKQNPGRVKSLHCKDWSSAGGYKVLLGEGAAPWKQIFEAAEHGGGVEYYLVEQEGSRLSPFETAKACLDTFHKLHG
jgi:sugar phosphate isomerase/epimerase